jgi:hypothetical protein
MKIFQKTSHVIVWLVFSFLLTGCQLSVSERKDVITIYRDSKATEIEIAKDLFKELPEDYIHKYLTIRLKGSEIPILGEITIKKDRVVFTPVIAFTPGLTYEVRSKNDLIATVMIPGTGATASANVISVFPSADTVPQNLLKIYVEFSQPMQQGYALENIVLIKNEKDTVREAFLDLQPELWNKEGTVITLWLDPGRIKRDLQPNTRLGNPLEEGNRYSLIVKKEWRDAKGNSMLSDHHKDFVTGRADTRSPDPSLWVIRAPAAGSKEALRINLHEPLDYLLLKNSVGVFYDNDKSVEGVMETGENETVLVFTPATPWLAWDYTLGVEARLEDLAGNNLNRLFDKDVAKKDTGKQKEVYSKYFTIK